MMQFRPGVRRGPEIEFRRAFRQHFLERMAFRLLGRLERTWQGAGFPRLAAFPADELGRQLVVRGIAERESLLILFDHILAAHADDFRMKVAVDVGANVGNHTLFFARRFARVLAFEPHPLLARILEVNQAINCADNVVIVPVALSDRDGEAEYLEIAEGNIGGSGLTDTHWSGGRAAGRRLMVPLELGDTAVSRYAGPEEIGLVKIDVEGHEPNVVRGLQRLLTRGAPIVLFEVRAGEAEQQGLAAWAFLESCGYSHFHIIEQIPALAARVPAPLRWGINAVDQLLRGVRYQAREIHRFEPRRHEFVIAAKKALL